VVSAEIAGIDHLVVLVDDLDRAARQAKDLLGFTVTPRSAHSRLGSANHCLMFEDGDYVELMGFVEDSPHLADLRRRLAEHGPGPAALALVTEDADEGFRRLEAAGLNPEPPLDFSRRVTLPASKNGKAGEEVEVAFRIVRFPASGKAPGPPLFLCEHRTRHQVRHPGWLKHENGVRALSFLRGTAPTPKALAELAAFYRQVFGQEAVDEAENRLEIRPAQGARLLWQLDPAFPEVELREVELASAEVVSSARTWGCRLCIRAAESLACR
jgi:catechol 2,3-dioxygenase-like lactoylglutathione lyase family enzyme